MSITKGGGWKNGRIREKTECTETTRWRNWGIGILG